MSIEQKLVEMGINLPEVPKPAGVYRQYRSFGGNLVYISGCGTAINGKDTYLGKLGRDLTVEEGQEAAKNCMLNALVIIKANLGSLDKIKSIVKILGFVASAEDFYDQPKVVNGATKFLSDIFGEEVGVGARSAIGTNVLPGNIPVEIELILELK
jgi:enamine deaminase RidA (YjgF/YER057c/UK114 family)